MSNGYVLLGNHSTALQGALGLTADDIAAQLAMARSNVSVSLRELLGWSLIRRVQAMGDRRDYYEAEADMFEMVRRIAQEETARLTEQARTALGQEDEAWSALARFLRTSAELANMPGHPAIRIGAAHKKKFEEFKKKKR